MTLRDWRLRDEREFLVRSLDDAAREHAAGDLSDEDFELLAARDGRRLAEVDAALRALEDAEAASAAERVSPAGPAAPPPPAGEPAGGRRARRPWVFWRRRWWLAAAGAVLVLAAVVLLLVARSGPRLPGETATGSVDVNTAQKIEQQLAQAQVLVHDGKRTEALGLYGTILSEDPKQPVALAEWGWLDWQAATSAKNGVAAAEGASAIVEAVRVDPRLYAAQYYLGAVLLQEGDAAKAVTHFRRFLADHPSAAWLHRAAPEVRAGFRAAHEPVPSAIAHA